MIFSLSRIFAKQIVLQKTVKQITAFLNNIGQLQDTQQLLIYLNNIITAMPCKISFRQAWK